MSAADDFLELRPAGGFDLIMADPPWSFDNWSAAGEAKNPKAHYACTPLDWIKALPVEMLAGRDCLLWLWATNPMLREAFAVLDAWGFTYATAGTWVKRTVHGKVAFGTGYVLRSSNEPILIGRIGAPKTSRSVRSVVATPMPSRMHPDMVGPERDWATLGITIEAVVREHSRKPDEAFETAERLMPDARRIELFSREERDGWSTWGNERGKFDRAPEEAV